jgi:V-type H+-transporting ATPase subunit C
MDYLKTWQWDEAKYPKGRSVTDHLSFVTGVVNHIDEEARSKIAQYNDFKTQRGNLAQKDGANLTGKDLIDVLTPDVVKATNGPDDDFIMTEHLVTVPIILPRGGEEEFLSTYETMVENMVPMSARKFKGPGCEDKDGNTLWRVVMFKSAVEGFKKACRDKRLQTRDFEYSQQNYEKLKQQRSQTEDQVKRQREVVLGLFAAAWSDVLVAWMHIKAMRVFVESVLRYGMPPSFACYILSPKSDSTAARKALADSLGKQVSAMSSKMGEDKGDADEDFFPYVSLSFTPFVVSRERA